VTHRLAVLERSLVPYQTALAWQRDLAQARIEGRTDRDVLILLEHPPVLTCGRSTRPEHLLDPSGMDVVAVERGGDVTYHGPGQLVGYPIVDLRAHRPDLHWYLRALEDVLVDAVRALGVPAGVRRPHTGVWTRGRKIASIGVHVKQWVTWHGFALNVTTDLDAFRRIVPCGLAGVAMTSVAAEGGGRLGGPPLWRAARDAVIAAFAKRFDAEVVTPAPDAEPAGRGRGA